MKLLKTSARVDNSPAALWYAFTPMESKCFAFSTIQWVVSIVQTNKKPNNNKIQSPVRWLGFHSWALAVSQGECSHLAHSSDGHHLQDGCRWEWEHLWLMPGGTEHSQQQLQVCTTPIWSSRGCRVLLQHQPDSPLTDASSKHGFFGSYPWLVGSSPKEGVTKPGHCTQLLWAAAAQEALPYPNSFIPAAAALGPQQHTDYSGFPVCTAKDTKLKTPWFPSSAPAIKVAAGNRGFRSEIKHSRKISVYGLIFKPESADPWRVTCVVSLISFDFKVTKEKFKTLFVAIS